MTYTAHGHHIPGSPTSDEVGVKPKVYRCGGTSLCAECKLEAQALTETKPTHTWRFAFRGRDKFVDAEDIFMAMSKFQDKYKGVEIDEMLITRLSV